MMPKRPRKINVLGTVYKVKYVDAENVSLEENDGIVDLEKKTIFISKTPSSKHYPIEKLIIHECIHAILYERGVRDMKLDFEHVIVEAMTDFIMEHFR